MLGEGLLQASLSSAWSGQPVPPAGGDTLKAISRALTRPLCCAGAHDVDVHFRETPFERNIPVLLGLASVWNVSFLGYPARAILPYTQALSKLAPHIQQARPLRPGPRL